MEALMYDLAHEAKLDIQFNGQQYEIRFADRPDMIPLRLSNLDDVMMVIKAILES